MHLIFLIENLLFAIYFISEPVSERNKALHVQISLVKIKCKSWIIIEFTFYSKSVVI